MGIYSAAIAAHRKREAEAGRREEETLRRLETIAATAFERDFGYPPSGVRADRGRHGYVYVVVNDEDADTAMMLRGEVGSIMVAGKEDHRVTWRLVGTCERCGKQVPSVQVRTLADLGKMLSEFAPALHECVEYDERANTVERIRSVAEEDGALAAIVEALALIAANME